MIDSLHCQVWEASQVRLTEVFVERYLTESRCKVYLGVLTLPKGQMARVAIKLRRPEGASTVSRVARISPCSLAVGLKRTLGSRTAGTRMIGIASFHSGSCAYS
eukprot:6478326-Amphidinium_carterae.1